MQTNNEPSQINNYGAGYNWLEANIAGLIEFLQELVATPSQNGVDTEQAAAELIARKLTEFGFEPQLLGDPTRPSVLCDFAPRQPDHKTLWLEAPLDTVVAGERESWQHEPFAAAIVEGKMYGRGSADCKAAIAIFVYVAAALRQTGLKPGGNLVLGFDADEQGGAFTGIKTLLEQVGRVDACIIGYPGNDEIAIAARGFLRLRITTTGQSAHTGMRTNEQYANAISLMARLIIALENLPMSYATSELFWFGPRLTVAQISGGSAINVVPEKCEIGVDLRLVPGQTQAGVLAEISTQLDTSLGPEIVAQRVRVLPYQYEPAYASPANSTIVQTLKANAEAILAKEIKLVASGPSNIGNVVGNRQIDTINGFGATGQNVHAANEYIEVDSLLPIAKVYLKTILDYLDG